MDWPYLCGHSCRTSLVKRERLFKDKATSLEMGSGLYCGDYDVSGQVPLL